MGVYSRFKKEAEGLRHLVELLESTPAARRQKMIDVGMQEDPAYTQRALQYTLTFQDVIDLPDLELTELLHQAPPRYTGYSIYAASDEIKTRFLSKAPPRIAAQIREYLEESNVSKTQIGTSQLKLIEVTRKLEREGIVKTKKIPNS